MASSRRWSARSPTSSEALSVTSTRLDRTQQQLAALDQQVADLTEQRTAIEAEIARRGDSPHG